ncbi:hypothetical protein MM300_06300 [Evansella sp. LMS18]|jgi:hypothetical protein|uniref:hypothetical protein n=1 Tax=Evansella sp. LMS18 TaxID=2924033 RepID=UPI0020D113E5|nr:hypothetical protein [Evansella sp. LMS18]UTR11906.1 hypothetical protein MM300_06300 [Evansella sp. LMS18]
MLKAFFHNMLAEYYLRRYNNCNSNKAEKRGNLIKRAYYHEDKLLEIKISKAESYRKQGKIKIKGLMVSLHKEKNESV